MKEWDGIVVGLFAKIIYKTNTEYRFDSTPGSGYKTLQFPKKNCKFVTPIYPLMMILLSFYA